MSTDIGQPARRRIPLTVVSESLTEHSVSLPSVLVLTDRIQANAAGHQLPDLVRSLAAVANDAMVVFREKDLPTLERQALAHEVAEACADVGLRLLIASDVALAIELGARGVQLSAGDPSIPSSTQLMVGRSCHNETDLDQARAEALDLALLSPVYPTASKPGYGPALGFERFGRLAFGLPFPVYALGGVGPGRAAACVLAGAEGVAVMGAVMTHVHPASVVASIVTEVAGAWAMRRAEESR